MMRGHHGVEADLTPEQRRQVFRRTWRALRPYRKRLWLGALCAVMQAAATLAGPAIVRYGIDHAIIPKDLTALNQAAAAYVAVVVCIYIFGRATILARRARRGRLPARTARTRVLAPDAAARSTSTTGSAPAPSWRA